MLRCARFGAFICFRQSYVIDTFFMLPDLVPSYVFASHMLSIHSLCCESFSRHAMGKQLKFSVL